MTAKLLGLHYFVATSLQRLEGDLVFEQFVCDVT